MTTESNAGRRGTPRRPRPGATDWTFMTLAFAGALVAALAAPRQAFAQARTGSVSGLVVDTATGQPVAAVQVRLDELHRGEVSHDDGRFTFLNVPAGTYTLVVQRIGYRPRRESVRVVPGEEVSLRLALEPSAVQLRAQVITANIGDRPGEEVLSPTSVISAAELDRRLGQTVAATLTGLPGVSVASTGPATARPVIRGLGGDRILVLEDGQRPGDLSSTSGDHAVAVDPLTAKQMEVVRGPMSLLYGSSALGGVVNVVREEVPRSVPEHLHGTVALHGETVVHGGSASAELRGRVNDQVAARGEVSFRRSGDTHTPLGMLTNTSSRAIGAALGGAYIGSRGHAGASYRFYGNEYGIPGGFVGAHEEGVDISMLRHAVRLEGELHPERGPFADVAATVTGTNYTHLEREKEGRVGTAFGQYLASMDLLARHEKVGPAALGALGMRVQYRDIATGGSLRTPPTYDWNVAGYLVEELGTGDVRVQLGARYDYARYVPRRSGVVSVGDEQVSIGPRSFGSVSGSAGLLWAATSTLRFGTSASRAYRTPDFNELYSNGPHLAANAYEVGDPSLEEETGIGVDVFTRYTGERARFEVAAFRNWLDDYISPSSRGRAIESTQGRPLFQYTNEDATFTGIEGEADVSLSRYFAVDATLSYVVAQFTNERGSIPVFTPSGGGVDTSFVAASRYPSLIPPLNGRLELRYDEQRWFTSAGTRFAAAQERLGDFEERTAGYAIVHLSAGYRYLVGEQFHTITLRVDNLLDAAYREHLSRTKSIMPEPGRNISLLYRLTY